MTVSEDFLLYSEYQVLHDTPKLQIISDIKKKILATQNKMLKHQYYRISCLKRSEIITPGTYRKLPFSTWRILSPNALKSYSLSGTNDLLFYESRMVLVIRHYKKN